jgi:hypothetical protein
MINTEKIAEILFEESQNIPEFKYLHTMNMLKGYPEIVTEEQIEKYIFTFDNPLRSRIQKYITKPCFICIIPECKILECCDRPCRNMACSCILGFIVLCIIGVVIWCIGTNRRSYPSIGSILNSTKTI